MAISKQTGVPLRGGDEYDALTRFRKYIHFRPGERKAAKTTFNRRARRKPVEVEQLDPEVNQIASDGGADSSSAPHEPEADNPGRG